MFKLLLNRSLRGDNLHTIPSLGLRLFLVSYCIIHDKMVDRNSTSDRMMYHRSMILGTCPKVVESPA